MVLGDARLTLGEETLRRQLAANWRNHLNVAERSVPGFELTTAPEAVDWMLARHAEHMQEKGFSGTTVYSAALQREAPEDFFRAGPA